MASSSTGMACLLPPVSLTVTTTTTSRLYRKAAQKPLRCTITLYITLLVATDTSLPLLLLHHRSTVNCHLPKVYLLPTTRKHKCIRTRRLCVMAYCYLLGLALHPIQIFRMGCIHGALLTTRSPTPLGI